MKMPKVSILVPIFNAEKFLPICLKSIFTQTYCDVEYIFVDDCSTDNSVMVLRNMIKQNDIPEENCSIVLHSENKGIATTRADLVNHAKGDYVLFVDSDDWIEANMVEEMLKATQNGQIDIVGCNFVVENKGSHSLVKENYSDNPYENMVRTINYDLFPSLWKLLIRRTLFEYFVIVPNINIGEDHIISVKLYYYAKSFAILDKYLYHYVQYNTSCLSKQRCRGLMDHVKVVGEIEKFFKEKNLMDDRIDYLLKMRKFNIKSNFLTKEAFDLNQYKNIFQEADSIWRNMNYTRNEQIKFWLAEKHWYLILRLLLKIKR